jgi:CheY-like chemotaxis protein
VRSLVEAHGGTIAADSDGKDTGACFTVWLPSAGLAAVDGSAPAYARPASTDSSAPDLDLGGVSVLLVDDEPDTSEVVAAQLQVCGASVQTAGSASAALDLIQQTRFDVLVSDIGMPGEDGYSLIRKIRSLSDSAAASIPAAALTALARKEDRRQALQAGFQMHLTKPVDSRTLVTAVATLNRLNGA